MDMEWSLTVPLFLVVLTKSETLLYLHSVTKCMHLDLTSQENVLLLLLYLCFWIYIYSSILDICVVPQTKDQPTWALSKTPDNVCPVETVVVWKVAWLQ